MGKILKFALITAYSILIACNSSNPDSAQKSNKSRSGEEIFTSVCMACHGLDGRAGVNGAANLAKSNLNEAGMAYIIENGSISGKMASYKGILSPDEIRSVAAYASTLKSK